MIRINTIGCGVAAVVALGLVTLDAPAGRASPVVVPGALAVTPTGTLVVAQPAAHRVLARDARGRWSVFAGSGRAGSAGDGAPATAAKLDIPSSLAVGADGTVYIADQGAGRIRAVRPDHTIVTVAGGGRRTPSPAGAPGRSASISHPSAITVDPAGGLLIVDNHGLLAQDADGRLTVVLRSGPGVLKLSNGPTAFFPDAVGVTGGGDIFVANSSPKQVLLVSRTGQVRGEWDTYVAFAGLAGASTSVYAADYGQFRVDRFTAGGPSAIVGIRQLGQFRPGGIAVARDGTVYVDDAGLSGGSTQARLVRLDVRGRLSELRLPH